MERGSNKEEIYEKPEPGRALLFRIWFKTYYRTKLYAHLSCKSKLKRLIAVMYLLEEGTIKLDNTRTFI
jgi:hypothetical protein